MLRQKLVAMMKWQARTLVLIGVFVLMFCAYRTLRMFGFADTPAGWLLNALAWVLVVPAIVFELIVLWFVFRTGVMAFGYGSGIIYLLLSLILCAVSLAFVELMLCWWAGLFVIPHMIRLDISRAYGADLNANIRTESSTNLG